jgi:hypothetical protein
LTFALLGLFLYLIQTHSDLAWYVVPYYLLVLPGSK